MSTSSSAPSLSISNTIHSLYKLATEEYHFTVTNAVTPLAALSASFWSTVLKGHSRLSSELACDEGPGHESLRTWLKECRLLLDTSVAAILLEETKDREALDVSVEEAFKALHEAVLDSISDPHMGSEVDEMYLSYTPLGGAEGAVQSVIDWDHVECKFHERMRFHTIDVTMKNRKLSINTTSTPFPKDAKPSATQPLVDSALSVLKKRFESPAVLQEFAAAITKKKQNDLWGRSFRRLTGLSEEKLFIQDIADVNFVELDEMLYNDNGHSKKVRYVTADTWNDCVVPQVKGALEMLEQDGLLTRKDRALLFEKSEQLSTDNVVFRYSIGYHPDKAVSRLFNEAYARVIAKERVKTPHNRYVDPPA